MLFVLLLSIGLTYLEISFYLESKLCPFLHTYPISIGIALMNLSIIKLITGFRGRLDPLIVLAGTGLFVFYGLINPETRLALQEGLTEDFYIANYAMLRICWAVFITTLHIFQKRSDILYFIASYGIILLLFKYHQLGLDYPTTSASIIVIPLAVYALSYVALIASKIIASSRLLQIFNRHK